MRLNRLNVDIDDEDEESDEISDLEELEGEKLGVANYGRSANFSRLNTRGEDDVLGGK